MKHEVENLDIEELEVDDLLKEIGFNRREFNLDEAEDDE